MSVGHQRQCNSFSEDSEEACRNHTDPGAEAEPEELDWDGYSTTLEHKLAAVGKPGLQPQTFTPAPHSGIRAFQTPSPTTDVENPAGK